MELLAPINLQTATSLVRAYEQRLHDVPAEAKQSLKTSPAPYTRVSMPMSAVPHRPPQGGPTEASSSMTPAAPRALAAAGLGGPRSRFWYLSIEEMADRRAKGLCYNFSEKCHHEHQCSMKGIYLLELDEDENDPER